MFGGFVGWRVCVLWVSCSLGVDCVSVDVRCGVFAVVGGFGCWVFLGLGLGLCSLGYCAWRVLGCDLKFSCGLVSWNLRV